MSPRKPNVDTCAEDGLHGNGESLSISRFVWLCVFCLKEKKKERKKERKRAREREREKEREKERERKSERQRDRERIGLFASFRHSSDVWHQSLFLKLSTTRTVGRLLCQALPTYTISLCEVALGRSTM